MSDIDLTEAVEDLAIRLRLADRDTAKRLSWAAISDEHRQPWRNRAQSFLRFVAPHIERQVREQVAREIEAQSTTLQYDDDEARVLHIAARIARGDS